MALMVVGGVELDDHLVRAFFEMRRIVAVRSVDALVRAQDRHKLSDDLVDF